MHPLRGGERGRSEGRNRLSPRQVSPPPSPEPHLSPNRSLVERGRLLRLMETGTRGPMTLLSAPAGAGKTTLVGQWATARKMRGVAWVDDDDLPVLGERLLTALVRHGLDLSGLDLGARDLDGPVPDLTGPLMGLGAPVVLVVDLSDQDDLDGAALDRLLTAADGLVRLVVMARSDPLLPLSRYRSAGSLTEIRMTDLAFTPDEAAALFRNEGLTLAPATVDALTERTHGWAAGLRFAAMSLSGHPDPESAAAQFRGDRGTVAEYLLAEVLGRQSAEARSALLRTSVLDVLRPGLVDDLGGDQVADLLRSMADARAFVDPVSTSPGSFRFHALFRELLRAQLAYESPDDVAGLRRRAAEWLAQHGQVNEAVRQAAAAGAWRDACRFVVDDLALGRVLLDGAGGVLAQAFADLPSDTPGAPAALLRAALAMTRFDLDGCAEHAAVARQLVSAGHGPQSWPEQLGLALLELILARGRGHVAAGLAAGDAMAQAIRAQDPTLVSMHPELNALLLSSRGALLFAGGLVPEARDVIAAGIDAARPAGCELPRYNCLGHLALIQVLRGELRAATSTADRALAALRGTELSLAARTPALEVALAWIRLEHYDLDAARRHARRAEASAGLPLDPGPRAVLAIVQARLLRADRRPESARDVLRRAGADLELAPWLRDRLRSEEAALALADGQVVEAERLLAQLSEPDEPDTSLTRAHAGLVDSRPAETDQSRAEILATAAPLHIQIAGWLLETSRLLEQQEPQQAQATLAHSLKLAEPETLRRPFLEAPLPVRDLLQQNHALVAEHTWMRVRPVDGAPSAAAPAPGVPAPNRGSDPPVLVEVLTAKEREVLALLAQLLTTQEIADAMFVSVNTVRTHVRNIMRKLAVSRRNEAVRRAQALQLLPIREP